MPRAKSSFGFKKVENHEGRTKVTKLRAPLAPFVLRS